MTHEREHRLDDRALATATDELERAAVDFDVPGKQTRTELIDRIASMYAALPPVRGHVGPGRTSAIAPKLAFHDFQALALRDVLSRLEQRRDLRDEILAAADPNVVRRVAERASRGAHLEIQARATPHGVGMWRATERRAVTLYRRARDTGAVSLRNAEVDAALVAIGSGTPLPHHVCQLMEPIFGMRLDRVRIHTGAVAEQACEAVNAEAFTVGEDIFLPSYNPSSIHCLRLLAHELTHCVQWWQGRIGPSAKCAVSRPSDALEQEADRFARKIDFDRLARPGRGHPHGEASSRPQAHAPAHHKESTTSAVAPAPASLPSPTPRAPGIQLVMRSAKDRYGRHESVPRHVEEPEESQWRTLTQRNQQRLKDFDSSMAVWKSMPRLVREQLKEMVFWLAVFVLPVLLVTRGKGSKTLKAMLESEIGRWLGIGIPLTSASVHLGKWFEAAWNADGDPAMVKVAQDEFAAMCVALATLRLQFRFQKGSSPEATSNLPALPTKQGSLVPLGSNAANGAVSLSSTTALPLPDQTGADEAAIDELLMANPISGASHRLRVETVKSPFEQHSRAYKEATTNGSQVIGDLRIAEQMAGLPEATELVPLDRGGDQAFHFKGKVNGQDAFVKVPLGPEQRGDIQKELHVANGWVSRGKIRWCRVVRVLDPKIGVLRPAVAMELVDGLSIQMLNRMMREGKKLPFKVTERHLEAVETWRDELLAENVSVIGEHPGQLLLTNDPGRLVVPVDMEIVPQSSYSPPDADDVVTMLRALIRYSAGDFLPASSGSSSARILAAKHKAEDYIGDYFRNSARPDAHAELVEKIQKLLIDLGVPLPIQAQLEEVRQVETLRDVLAGNFFERATSPKMEVRAHLSDLVAAYNSGRIDFQRYRKYVDQAEKVANLVPVIDAKPFKGSAKDQAEVLRGLLSGKHVFVKLPPIDQEDRFIEEYLKALGDRGAQLVRVQDTQRHISRQGVAWNESAGFPEE